MGCVLFAYIDDAGNYEQQRTNEFVRRNPYYIRSCVILPAADSRNLTDRRKQLCQQIDLEEIQELKWQHLWKLKRRDQDSKTVSYKAGEDFLRNITYDNAMQYAAGYLALLSEFNCSVATTITALQVMTARVDPVKLEKMHLQSIVQRINFEASSSNQIAALFIDNPSDRNLAMRLADAYSSFVRDGGSFNQFKSIHDTVGFHDSKHSAGLQMADFVAGVCNGACRGYQQSVNMFTEHILPRLRISDSNDLYGYGIIHVPTHDDYTPHMLDVITKVTPVVQPKEDPFPF